MVEGSQWHPFSREASGRAIEAEEAANVGGGGGGLPGFVAYCLAGLRCRRR